MSGNGVILERLSGKKLSVLVTILFIAQILFFLIGALKFPNATHTETVEGIMCKDRNAYKRKGAKIENEFFYLRDYLGRPLANCERIEADQHNNIILNTKQKEIVYAFQIPLPRDNKVLKLYRWFQTMSSILQLQVVFPPKIQNKLKNLELNETGVSHMIPLDIRLAYHNTDDLDDIWHEMARGEVNKKFTCFRNPYSLDCDMIELFELGSVHHQFYGINIRLGESEIVNSLNYHDESAQNFYLTSELPEVRLVLTFIYQTGGFTQMWFIMKSCMFPLVLFVMIWYWNRIVNLDRESNLLERILFALGISLCLLNMPVEWLTLHFDLKWMTLYTDLRQGIFYSILFTFWIVFCGEHFIDENQISACPNIKSYWRYVGAVWLGCFCLLVFELSHRGMQLSDPFYSIWDSTSGHNLATAMILVACASGLFYFGLLLYLVGKVYLNLRSKKSQLPSMNRMRRAFYEGIIYRFQFLMVYTIFCAALSIAFFIVNNINETQWRFGDEETYFNYSGAFFTSVYGMWNIYVIAVMIFYAPSHKNKTIAKHYEQDQSEEIEFVNIETRLTNKGTHESVLAEFATKMASN
ncbi:unnamed protein product [Brachionus calyciflorus]|uniref:Wntless n=1 Tax=Brachionus calyciflorus TaxID=104777 RepID=A0A813NYJ2_9BILA|nr:unnamed protein product [Brachionus calyciflorus]